MVTLVAFAYYWQAHPGIWQQMRRVGWAVVLLIMALYIGMMAVLALMYDATLRLIGTKLAYKENLLVTMYSSIVNFFGPLQSGPGFRLLYLKRRHGVSAKAYAAASLLYYGLFALMSGVALLAGGSAWQLLLGLAAVGIVVVLVAVRIPLGRRTVRLLRPVPLLALAVATGLQVLLTCVIYFVELWAIGTHVSFAQAISYAGAANFALFVSLTPGALGFRESFLFFSQGLHHIDANSIVVANVLDRGVYVMFLALLFGFILLSHARDGLKIS